MPNPPDAPRAKIDVAWPLPDQPVRSSAALSREQIVTEAVGIADVEGVDALSMRRIAAALGSGTMSLYRHVPNKAQLLDLMADVVYAEIDCPEPGADWQADLRQLMHNTRQVMLRHPWFVRLTTSRPPIGPNALRYLNAALALIERLGLDATSTASVLDTLSEFAFGALLTELAEAEARRRSGLTEQEWRQAVAPYLGAALDTGQYPHLRRRVVEAEDQTPQQQFEFGLDCVLGGIAARFGDRLTGSAPA